MRAAARWPSSPWSPGPVRRRLLRARMRKARLPKRRRKGLRGPDRGVSRRKCSPAIGRIVGDHAVHAECFQTFYERRLVDAPCEDGGAEAVAAFDDGPAADATRARRC